MTDEPTTPGPDGTPGDPDPAAVPPMDPNQAAGAAPPPTGNRAGIVAIIVIVLIALFLLFAWLFWWSDDDDAEDTLGTGTVVEGVTLPDASTIPDGSIVDGATLPTIEVTLPPETTVPPTTVPPTTAPPATTTPPTTAPPETTTPPTTTIPEIVVPEGGTLLDIITTNDDLARVAQLVETAGLSDALATTDPLTLFLPTNDAVDEYEASGADLTDPDAVAGLLLGHAAPERLDAAAVLAATEIPTLSDAPLIVDADAVTINGANIVLTDVEGANGYIHMVDAVLIGG